MPALVLPYSLVAETPARAEEVQGNFDAIKALLNATKLGQDNIQANAIVAGLIATGAVTTGKIADGAVTNPKIADNAVTTPKIADGNVTAPKIGTNAVTTAKIQDNAVTSAKANLTTVTDTLGANTNLFYGTGGGGPIYTNLCHISDLVVGGHYFIVCQMQVKVESGLFPDSNLTAGVRLVDGLTVIGPDPLFEFSTPGNSGGHASFYSGAGVFVRTMGNPNLVMQGTGAFVTAQANQTRVSVLRVN